MTSPTHPHIALHMLRGLQEELARAAERSRRRRESSRVRVRRPRGKGDPSDL